MVDTVQDLRWLRQHRRRTDSREKVLEVLRERDTELGELVSWTGLSKGTVNGLLTELIEEGVARHEPGGRGGPHPKYVHVLGEAAEMFNRRL